MQVTSIFVVVCSGAICARQLASPLRPKKACHLFPAKACMLHELTASAALRQGFELDTPRWKIMQVAGGLCTLACAISRFTRRDCVLQYHDHSCTSHSLITRLHSIFTYNSSGCQVPAWPAALASARCPESSKWSSVNRCIFEVCFACRGLHRAQKSFWHF